MDLLLLKSDEIDLKRFPLIFLHIIITPQNYHPNYPLVMNISLTVCLNLTNFLTNVNFNKIPTLKALRSEVESGTFGIL